MKYNFLSFLRQSSAKLLLCLSFGFFSGAVYAVPAESTIASTDVRYWVGSGSNHVVVACSWAQPDTALAWGVCFNSDSISLLDALSIIGKYDYRFTLSGAITNFQYANQGDTFSVSQPWGLMYNVNGVTAQNMASEVYLHHGDFAKVGDIASMEKTDSTYIDMYGGYYEYKVVWTTPVVAATVADATISASDVEMWVGKGANKAVVALSWAQPDTALAWGVRFSSSISLTDALDTIARHDSRFAYEGAITDFHYNDSVVSLGVVQQYYIMFNLNGTTSNLLASGLMLSDGDFVKVGDMASMVKVDSVFVNEYGGYYNYQVAWQTVVNPVSAIELDTTAIDTVMHGPFCGAVGTEGCNAIAADSSLFVAWATACSLQLGYTNIASPTTLVSYGDSSKPLGPVDKSDNLNVVSLGDGGMATLTFDGEIYNGEGPDFAVFENSFNDFFLELAFVEVSSDGKRYVRFPATSLTSEATQITSTGALDPTYINNLAGKYRMGYGTPFDLDELRDSTAVDINHITHVRIVDVVGSLDSNYCTYDAFGHRVNDPYPTISYSGGFDLAGVGVIHFSSLGVVDANASSSILRVYPNPSSTVMNCVLSNASAKMLAVYDMQGRCVMQYDVSYNVINTITVGSLPAGVYIVRVVDANANTISAERIVVRH